MKSKNLGNAGRKHTNFWQQLTQFSTRIGILSVLLFTTACTRNVANQTPSNPSPESTKPSPAETPTDPFAQTQREPNFVFNVEPQSGTCPKTVGLWMFVQGYEGGADHTVVADTQAIASAPAKLVVSEKKRLEYEAPLSSEYASCVGQARSDLTSTYNFQFRDGKVRFRMDVSRDDGYREILYKGVSAFRPYIHWRAEE
ncbi:MAG: hypothetical protein AB1861_27350 [Cyanobacteriota bacterium]